MHSDKVWGDHNSTEPVGSHPGNASPYGVMDMAGNIWEWCNDFYTNDYYSKSPARNPTGPTTTILYVAHGGAWPLCDPKCFQTVNRDWCRRPLLGSMDAGFRCVITGENPQSSGRTPPPPATQAPVSTPALAIAPVSTTAAQPVMPMPEAQAKTAKKQYLYTVDSAGGTVYKVDLADGSVEILSHGGPNVSVAIDSKGNIYTAGGSNLGRKAAGSDKMLPFLKGLSMGFGSVMDSKDNYYFGDYIGKNCRIWKLPVNKVANDMLPFILTYKDPPKTAFHDEDPDITPAGVVIQVDNFTHNPYGMSCDAYDNIYVANNPYNGLREPGFISHGYITKITPKGKVTRFDTGQGYGVNLAIANASGGLTMFEGVIFEATSDCKPIGIFAPGIDNHHSRGIAYDEQGNLYQSNPPEKKGDPKDPECMTHIYKYTPDGRRSVLANFGRSCWFCDIYPRTQYPRIKPAE